MPSAEAAGALSAAVEKLLDAMARVNDTGSQAPYSQVLAALAATLTLEELTDLLKQPTCVGEGRRVVLRELRVCPESFHKAFWTLRG